jgi:hypothetical protein
MRKAILVVVLLLTIGATARSAEPAKPEGATLWVPLTLTERVGVDRLDEPVTTGVPLPEGLVEDPGKLVLLGPDGTPVPAQFTVATRWYPGRSIKWVLLDFQASVSAGASRVYALTDVGKNPAPPHPVTVEGDGDAVTLATGTVRLAVKRKGFNLFDQVSVAPKGDGQYTETLLGGKQRMRIELAHGGVGLPTLKKFSPANDPDVTLDVELRGPMRAVVKLTGKHLSTDKLPGDHHLLDFVCRITACAGSGRVKVDYSLECKQGESISVGVPLDRWWFATPLVLDAKTRTWAVGLKDGQYMGPGCDPKLIPEWNDEYEKPPKTVRKYYEPGLHDCIVHSLASDRVVYRGDFWRKRRALVCRGKHEKKAAATVGWMDLADARKGMTASIRWFWQTWPRGIMVGGNNMYVMGQTHLAPKPDLLTRSNARRAHYYPGMSKTTEFLFYFHGPRDVTRIVSAHAGLQAPLRAWAAPAWYCERTQAFGRLVSASKAHFDDEDWQRVRQYDANVAATKQRILKHRDLEFGDYDSYGMFNFGDTINFIKQQRGDPCDRYVTWDNCYYDYPHALLLQWARTGDPDYFDMFEQAQHHLMDLDMVCYHPDPKMVGANRYCDGTMHIRQSGGIYVSGTFNHYKTQSHFERYYLTGFRRARDMGVLSAEFSLTRNAMSFGQPRSLGHGPLGALAGWEATGERRFLDRFIHFEKHYMDRVDAGARISKGRHWQGGIGFEGMREYYEHCGDPRALKNLAVQVEACAEKGDYAASTLHAFAFLGAQLDKPEWTKKARDRIARLGAIQRSWGYGQSFGNQLRNAPYVFWYLTQDLPKKHRGVPGRGRW